MPNLSTIRKPFKKLNESMLITPKLLYLSIGLLIFTLHAFREAFITEYIKISKRQFSFVMGIISFIGFFTNIGLAYVGDRFNNPKLCILALILVSTSSFQIFLKTKNSFNLFWPLFFVYYTFTLSLLPFLDRYTMELLPVLKSSVKYYGSQRLFGTISFPLSSFIVEELLKNGETDKSEYEYENLKWYQGVLALVSGVAVVCFVRGSRIPQLPRTNSLIDENRAKETGQNTKKGPQKNKGAENDKGDENNEPSITTQIEQGNQTETGGSSENTTNNPGTEPNEMNSPFLALMKNGEYIFFIFIVLMNGITRSAMTLFLTKYWKDSLKLNTAGNISNLPDIMQTFLGVFVRNPIGTCTTFGVLFEVTVLFFSAGIIRHLGYHWPLLLAQVAQLARFIGYLLLSNKNRYRLLISCLLETMKGLNFALTHVSAVQLSISMCPPSLKGTSTMIYNGAFTGMSAFIAGIIFGLLFKDPKAGNISYTGFFLTNIFICVFAITCFTLKYGYDGVLFNRSSNRRVVS